MSVRFRVANPSCKSQKVKKNRGEKKKKSKKNQVRQNARAFPTPIRIRDTRAWGGQIKCSLQFARAWGAHGAITQQVQVRLRVGVVLGIWGVFGKEWI